ncbi:type II secretion system protein N [Zhongshania borealis]|uniref:type II secretion system protein N n=1 Tax=Zhongshania borealis TaxID=889488 RepID=UPI0031E7EB30
MNAVETYYRRLIILTIVVIGAGFTLLSIVSHHHLQSILHDTQLFDIVDSSSNIQPMLERSANFGHENTNPSISLNLLNQLAMMGERATSQTPPALDSLPETGLSLSLAGVLFSSAQGRSAAMISINGQPAKYYRSGTEIQPGLELLEIRPDQVAIRNQGVYEKIVFDVVTIWSGSETPTEYIQNDLTPSNEDVNTLASFIGEGSGISRNTLMELLRESPPR